MNNQPHVQPFFDEKSHTFSYVVSDPETSECAIIDSVLDYDAASVKTTTLQADKIIDYIQKNSLSNIWILETHVHADHLTASQYLKEQVGGQIAMSKNIAVVQETFSAIYHLEMKYFNAYQNFDYLFEDGEEFKIGNFKAYNIATPGHTPACLSYVIGNAVFVGDTLFMPDYGTARCDFPKGSAAQLYDSVQRLYTLPLDTRVFLCHDYLPTSRQNFQCETTIQQQINENIHLNKMMKKIDFIEMRNQRDANLSMPSLILPAIQINMNAGIFPEAESNGIQYLKLPLNYF